MSDLSAPSSNTSDGQVAADLRAAADVLERDGWTQGQFHRVVDGQFCHCAEGAVAVAVGDHSDLRTSDESVSGIDWTVGFLSAYDRRAAAVRSLRDSIGEVVPFWNDMEGRTAAEVIAALRAAADRAEAQS